MSATTGAPSTTSTAGGPPRPPTTGGRWKGATTAFGAAGATATAVVIAHFVAQDQARVLHDRMLPWILGRGLGVAAYLTLTALVGIGLWFRHPWRRGTRALVRPATLLRAHAALAAASGVLVAGHVVALALDAYAGVGWAGALLPGRSHYRPVAVALGTAALYLAVLIGTSAALAGRLVGRHWLAVHRLALATFVVMWLHGVEAGSDVTALSWLYVASGVLVTILAVSRVAARRAERPLRSAS